MEINIPEILGVQAVDCGDHISMRWSHPDDLFIFAEDHPISAKKGFVLGLGKESEEDALRQQASRYRKALHDMGHITCSVGVLRGDNVLSRVSSGFIGGIDV